MACVKNIGSNRLAFAGVGYDTSVGSPLTVNGTRQRGDLAVEVEGPRRSLLGLAPTIFSRASVWTPRFVGAWTYWVILLFGVAATVLAARLVLVGENGGEARRWRGLPRAAWAIAALALLNGLAWAVLAPPWQAPDEIEHFAYAQRLAETREPTNDSGAFLRGYSTEHQYAMESALTNTVRQNPKGKPPWEDGSRARLGETGRPRASFQERRQSRHPQLHAGVLQRRRGRLSAVQLG